MYSLESVGLFIIICKQVLASSNYSLLANTHDL